ncbi:protein kinase [Planctomycetota bacterium]
MSEAKKQNNKQPKREEIPPTASFDSTVPMPGGRIGRFQIESEIGRGGMGIVYLAQDTKLNRPVAIKCLPPEVMGDDTIRSRLEREARLLASLNHANIATIYEELGVAEGIGYLVLEYVAGETLAERIAFGKLPIEEALSIGLQIAEAVSAAHSDGIIHRDLKPGNIKITPDDAVKVLDFGIAKSAKADVSGKASTLTKPGRIIGTPAFMSPEQTRGKAIDHRSDIWSFGCVLYEMLTGVPAFEGQTSSDTLAGVLRAEPNWQKLPEDTPNNIRVLLRRCLEKDSRRRLHDIADAAIEIRETLDLPTVAPPTTTASLERARPAGWKKLVVFGAVCLLVGMILGAGAILSHLWPDGQLTQPITRFVVYPETSFEFEALWHCALALSPDGKRLAYVEEGSDGRRKIYVRELNEFKARALPGTEGAISPFFSPDGEWIGYVDHFQRKLKKVSLKGGEPIILADAVHFRGGSWGVDDSIIFSPARGIETGGGLWRISASGERLRQLTAPDLSQGDWGHVWPQILPSGQWILFTSYRLDGTENRFELYSLQTGERHTLMKGGTYARYVSTGHIVYADNKTLYAVRFDLEKLKVVGSAVPVVQDVMTPGSGSAQCTISGEGSLAYIPGVMRSAELTPVWVDRQGQFTPLPAATPRNYGDVRISPDGRRVAFTIQEGGNFNVWLYDLTRDTLNPQTSDGNSLFPIWASDGNSLMFASYSLEDPQLIRQSMGGGEPELLTSLGRPAGIPVAGSPDNNEVLLVMSDLTYPKRDQDIYVVSLDGESENQQARPFIQRNHNQRLGLWSPDGRWVAYTSDESGRWEVYVEPYPGPGPKMMVSTEGGFQPVWSRDGKELSYRHGDKMIVASVETKPEFKVTRVEQLFEGQYLFRVDHTDYDVTPDGRFLMIREPEESAPLGINITLNWFDELKQLVPPDGN